VWATYLVNGPIFFFSSVSVAFFYLMSQKALRPTNWWKEVIYLPCLLALGIGMSINNARAVIEAVFNHQSGFVRTPKYGIGKKEKKSNSWMNSRYKALKNLNPIVELAFGIFFTIILADRVLNEKWVSAILLLPFPIGFYYTSLSSLARFLPSFTLGKNRESDS